MNQKNQWTSPIIAILLGTCIGLTTLLIQEKTKVVSNSYAAPVEKAAPSVVSIYTQVLQKNDLINDGILKETPASQDLNLGSGVIVSKDGLILTNHHVIQNAQRIIVGLNDDRQVEAKLIGSDPSTDLAVLKINIQNLTPIQLGNSDSVSVGDKTLAIGNPFGIGQTVTFGIISAKGRNSIGLNTYENFLQTDAAINPGNSGGALINLKGELIGISSAIYSSSGGSQGIGFAIPIDDAVQVMSDLVKSGRVVRAYLGMDAKKVTSALAKSLALPVDHGLLVSEVTKESPADKAGIQIGDIIVKINNTTSDNPLKTRSRIASMKPGTTISLLGFRGKQSYQTRITLETQPAMQSIAY